MTAADQDATLIAVATPTYPPGVMVPAPDALSRVSVRTAMSTAMARSKGNHGGMELDYRGQIPRLRRIEAQVRGLQQMIGDRRCCVDVAHQINAVVAANLIAKIG